MASVEQTTSGKWRVVYYFDGQRRRSPLFADIEQARDWEAVRAAEIARGQVRDRDKGRIPFTDYAALWLALRPTGPNHGQARSKERWAIGLLGPLGTQQIGALTRTDVQRWVDSLVLAPSSIRSAYQVLSQILRTAAADGYLPAGTPLGRGLIHLPAPSTEPSWTVLTQPELDHLLAVCLETFPAQYPIVRLLADTGLRQGEAFALRRRDVGDGWVDVLSSLKRVSGAYVEGTRTKSGRRRRVVLGSDTQAALKAQLDAHEHVLVFPGRGGTARDVGAWRTRQWKPLVVSAGFPDLDPHHLRHTHASLLLAAGVSPEVVAQRLGHASTRMVWATYGHALPGGQTEALRLLARRS